MTKIMGYPDGATLLDPEEMQGLLFTHITTREQLNEVEQANIEGGLSWLNRQTSPKVLSQEFLCTLHNRLFGKVWKWAGEFRRTKKNIGIDPHEIGIELRKLLDDTNFWIANHTYRPSESAIRFHHRLVFIHLFPNGNGRHGRIATDALLEKALAMPPINWSGGLNPQDIHPRRAEYIAALRAADHHDYGPLIAFIGERPD